MRGLLIASLLLLALRPALSQTSQPQVSYTALSDAARKSGQLVRYEQASVQTGVLKLDEATLEYTLPELARAYDVIPVHYKLTRPAGTSRLAVEAVAFEHDLKAKETAFFDLALPGTASVSIEYLGSLGADYNESKYVPLGPDPEGPTSPFPPFDRQPFVRSAVIQPANALWFKFRITNTGDTILDPDGFGGSMAIPTLTRYSEAGEVEWVANSLNAFERQLEYLYPGESVEQWVNFYCPRLGAEYVRGLKPGRYQIDFRMACRYYKEFNWWVNIWAGVDFTKLTMPLTVTPQGGQEEPELTFLQTPQNAQWPGFLERFEEFMTSFVIHQPATRKQTIEATLYLQVAPWTKRVVLKLMTENPKKLMVAKIPVKVSDETLRIKPNPNNEMVVRREDGFEEPAILAMAMPGMRTGIQLGPYPEDHLYRELAELKALGVNLISSTAGNWWVPEVTGRKGVELHSACYKYFYDVLMRKLDMKVLGWSVYPPSGLSWYTNAEPVLGRQVKPSLTEPGYNAGAPSVDMGDPAVPEVIAAWTEYNWARWGDLWFRSKTGRVPIEMEDTWGWMRDDINVRYYLGPLAKERFRDWLQVKYGTLKAVNQAWGSDYESFEAIDPEANQGDENFEVLHHGPVYNKPEHPFHDWSKATEDWDVFRTELRMDILRKANSLIQQFLPGGELSVRTEGANLVCEGKPDGDNSHWRHVYYSQRRNAMVFEVVKQADVLHFYNDYTTLPYTETEWRQGMREMVKAGVVPLFLPQFDHMRDIVLNDYYGRDYQSVYNLEEPRKGMMIHCLMAAYPWWKATYEEGGAPGILWSDYGCDGFATETQKRELKLLRGYLNEAAASIQD